MSRFGIREATPADAIGIARAHTESWQTSYRGILPDTVLADASIVAKVDSVSSSRDFQAPSATPSPRKRR